MTASENIICFIITYFISLHWNMCILARCVHFIALYQRARPRFLNALQTNNNYCALLTVQWITYLWSVAAAITNYYITVWLESRWHNAQYLLQSWWHRQIVNDTNDVVSHKACVPAAAGSNHEKFSFDGSQRLTENIEYNLVKPDPKHRWWMQSLAAAECLRIFVYLQNPEENWTMNMYPWTGFKYFIFVKGILVPNIVSVLLYHPQHDKNILMGGGMGVITKYHLGGAT